MSTKSRELIKEYEIAVCNHIGKSLEFSWLGKGILSDVRHQGNCSACWAFVIADSIQSQFAIEMKNLGYKPRIRHLAPQEMVDCFKEKFPGQKLPDDDPLKCYTNSFENGFEYVKKYGICEEKDYPYMGKGGCCQDCLIEGPKYFIDNYEVVDQQDVIAAIEQMPLPCGIAFLTKESDKLLQHTEGIIQTLTLEEIKKIEKERKKDDKKEGEKDKKEGKKDIMFHAVLIVGYGKEEDGSEYFLIKNTLGEMWGKLGYGKLDRSGAIFFTRQTKTIFKEGPQLV